MKFEEALIEKINHTKKGFALTGAGISAPSGIPTFRGEDGFWKDKDPHELASQSGFRKEPQLIWDWYNYRRDLIRKSKPNPAHYALVELENSFNDFAIITQNVDNFHQDAGSKNVLELHGNIFRNKCNDCGKIFGEINSKDIPNCDACGGYIRPDVVWFGEPLPKNVLERAWQWSEESDICFIIGTSAMVQPAASLPLISRENGAFVIEINKNRTVISSYVDKCITGEVTSILPALSKLRIK